MTLRSSRGSFSPQIHSSKLLPWFFPLRTSFYPLLGSSGDQSLAEKTEGLDFAFYRDQYLYCPPIPKYPHVCSPHCLADWSPAHPGICLIFWFAVLTLGRTSLPFGKELLAAWKHVSTSAGTAGAPSVGSRHQWAKSCITQAAEEAGRGLCNSRQETGRFPRVWASFLASPQEMSSSCFSSLNLPPLPIPLSGWFPNPPTSGQPPSHTRFGVESLQVKREASREWAAERQRRIHFSSRELVHCSGVSCPDKDHRAQQT